MSPRGRLRGGMPRVYRDHRTGIGAAYRRVYEAISREHGPFEPGGLRALQASQAASLWLSFVAATETLTEARERRASDRGRRPSPRQIDRLEHRQQVASRAFAEALDALKGKTTTAEQERRDFEAFVAKYRKPAPEVAKAAQEPRSWIRAR